MQNTVSTAKSIWIEHDGYDVTIYVTSDNAMAHVIVSHEGEIITTVFASIEQFGIVDTVAQVIAGKLPHWTKFAIELEKLIG